MSGLTMTACLISTLINMIVLDRVFTKVYLLNIKQAFTSPAHPSLVKYTKRESEKLMFVNHQEVEGFAESLREGEGKTSAH